VTPIDECPQIYRDLEFHVRRLHELLAKPEPGLWSWVECVFNEAAGIAALRPPPPAATSRPAPQTASTKKQAHKNKDVESGGH